MKGELRDPIALHSNLINLDEVSPRSRYRWENTWNLEVSIGHLKMTLGTWHRDTQDFT